MSISPRLYAGVRAVNAPSYAVARRLDRSIIPMVNRMMRNGIAVSIPDLQEFSLKLGRLMKAEYDDIRYHIPGEVLERFVAATTVESDEGEGGDGSETGESGDEAGTDLYAAAESININSPDQLADLLYSQMNLGAGTKLKMTKNGKRVSTGKKQLEALKSEHPIIAAILRYREYAKLKNTYADKMPRIARWDEGTKTWRIYTQYLLTRTETSRLASKNPNLQNIPSRSLLGQELRACFTASPGCVLLSRDYSQIELRVLAHMAGVQRMLDVFAEDGDIHDATTRTMYNITMDEWKALAKPDQKRMRTPVKNLQFGLVYGLTSIGLQQGLMINNPPIFWTEDECQAFIDQWYTLYPEVRAYMQQVYMGARRYGMVWGMFGHTRLIPGVRSVHSWIQAAALREAGNCPIQMTAAEILKLAIPQIEDDSEQVFRRRGIRVEPLLQVHDELIWDVEEDYVEAVSEWFGEVMGGAVKLRCPLKSEAVVGRRWKKD